MTQADTPAWGDAIPVDGIRPFWLPDDVGVQFRFEGIWAPEEAMMWDDHFWSSITAIRLKRPRYDSVYLALERGFVPWLGGDKAPGDWDGVTALFRDATIAEDYAFGWDWQHHPDDPAHVRAVEIIGYHQKPTSTALPLAQPAAVEGEEGVVLSPLAALRVVMSWINNWGVPFADDDEWQGDKALIETAIAASGADASTHPSLELCIQFSDDGKHIRKWSRLPFEGGECLYSHPLAALAPAPQGEEANVLPDNLAELIEHELNAWRGANGGVYAIHAAALGVSIKIRAAMLAALAPAAIASGREGEE